MLYILQKLLCALKSHILYAIAISQSTKMLIKCTKVLQFFMSFLHTTLLTNVKTHLRTNYNLLCSYI